MSLSQHYITISAIVLYCEFRFHCKELHVLLDWNVYKWIQQINFRKTFKKLSCLLDLETKSESSQLSITMYSTISTAQLIIKIVVWLLILLCNLYGQLIPDNIIKQYATYIE